MYSYTKVVSFWNELQDFSQMLCNSLFFFNTVFFLKMYLKICNEVSKGLREDVYRVIMPFVFAVFLKMEFLIRKH